MSTELKWTKNSQFQSLLFAALAIFFVAHFVLLSPSSLEDDFNGMRVIQPKDLLSFLKNEPTAIAPEVPLEIAPSYSLRDNVVFASNGIKPNFRMVSRKSNIYQKEQIGHSRDVKVEFVDRTQITAKEAVFFINKDQIRFYGDVHTAFPNGSEMLSEYAEVFTKPVTRIVIPTSIILHGSKKSYRSNVQFTSYGMEYTDTSPKAFHLLKDVHVRIMDEKETDVYSDQAIYTHEEGHLHFFMNETRPLSEQFVRVNQPDLDLKSRTLDVDTSNKQELQTITALNDVWLKDAHDPEKISTATSGKGVFYQAKNEIVLTEFPQVYQEDDTITGDVIIFHRNTDLIEVKQSNAIYNGNQGRSKSNP